MHAIDNAGQSLQERYAPLGRCFGCGPANPVGLRIGSRPSADDPAFLVARWQPDTDHEAFAGVVNGGILGTLLDCHANWTASWHLMRARAVDRPPTTVTLEYGIRLRRPTPSDRPIDLRAWVVDASADRATVEAELRSDDVVTATGTGTFVAVRPDHPAYDRWKERFMFRRFLGLDRQQPDPRLPVGDAAAPLPDSAAETATARRIVARLEALPPAEARFLACFAYVMSRAANADFDISADETALMEQFAVQFGGLDTAQAVLVVEMAKLQALVNGGTEDFVVTREFRSISAPDQRLALLRCCFAIAAVDGSITADEASTINEIGRELDLEAADVNTVRAEFHEQLSSVQALRRAGAG